MGAGAFFSSLIARGLTLTAEKDGIRVRGGKLTDADRAAIRSHKAELLTLLRTGEAANEPTATIINDHGDLLVAVRAGDGSVRWVERESVGLAPVMRELWSAEQEAALQGAIACEVAKGRAILAASETRKWKT